MATSPTFAGLCEKAFDREEQTLSIAIQVEALKTSHEIYQHISSPQVQHLIEAIDRIINTWETSEESLSKSDFDSLKERVQTLQNLLNKKTYHNGAVYHNKPGQQNPAQTGNHTTWESFKADPSLIEPDKPYLIKWENNRQANIVFNKHIVESFFRSESSPFKTDWKKIARKNITAITKGFTTDSSGIRMLKQTASPHGKIKFNQLFEIKTLGAVAGHIRVGGFIYDGTMYVVYYIKSSDHDKSRVNFIHNLREKLIQFQTEQEKQARHQLNRRAG